MAKPGNYHNSGAVWPNTRKKSEKHPDYTGKGVITCPRCNETIEFWLSAWVKDFVRGKFLSLAITWVEQYVQRQSVGRTEEAPPDLTDADKPF